MFATKGPAILEIFVYRENGIYRKVINAQIGVMITAEDTRRAGLSNVVV